MMSLTIPSDLEQAVTAWIDRGDYSSPNAVLQAAMVALQEKKDREQKLEDLRREIDLGLEDIAAGRVAPLDIQAILRTVRARRASPSQAVE